VGARKTGLLARSEPQTERERSAVPQQPARQPAASVHAQIGRLQQTIGNRAVARLAALQPNGVVDEPALL